MTSQFVRAAGSRSKTTRISSFRRSNIGRGEGSWGRQLTISDKFSQLLALLEVTRRESPKYKGLSINHAAWQHPAHCPRFLGSTSDRKAPRRILTSSFSRWERPNSRRNFGISLRLYAGLRNPVAVSVRSR